MTDFEKKLAELFLELPEPLHKKTAEGVVVPAQVANNFIYTGLVLPLTSGKISYKGRLGLDVTLDQGRMASRHALLAGLGVLRETLGSLNSIKQMIQLNGLVATGGNFQDFDAVFEPASKLLFDIFGAVGRHSRTLVGVNQLPQGACVALSLIAALR